MNEKRRIFTHINPDMDAIFSVLGGIVFFLKKDLRSFFQYPGWRDIIKLKEANWDGKGMGTNDIAVDLSAGGKGIKGQISEDGRIDSAFQEVISMFAPKEINEALADFICYVNTSDSTGDVIGMLAGSYMEDVPFKEDYLNIIKVGSLEYDIKGVKAMMGYGYKNQLNLFEHYALHFLGQIKMGKQLMHAKEMYPYRVVSLLQEKGSPVCINMNNAPFELCHLAFQRGAEVIIFSNGNQVGIQRRPHSSFPVNHPKILEVIKKKNERWYYCPHLLCTGTPKSPPSFETKVNVSSLCVAVQSVYRQLYKNSNEI